MNKTEKQGVTNRIVQVTENLDPLEFGLVVDFASLRGLKRATALKMHLRETLPSRIADEKAKVNGVHNG